MTIRIYGFRRRQYPEGIISSPDLPDHMSMHYTEPVRTGFLYGGSFGGAPGEGFDSSLVLIIPDRDSIH